LDLVGEEFLRRARVESSDDGLAYGVLAEGGRVWAVRGEPGARGAVLRYPASQARFLRVTLLAGAGDVRIAGAQVAPPPARVPSRSAPVEVVAVAREDGRRTVVDLDLGGRPPPRAALVVEASTPAFERTVRAQAREGEALRTLGCGVVWRAPEAPPDAREHLAVALSDGAPRRVRARLGPLAPNPRHAPRPDDRPFTERHRGALGVALAALVAALGAWAVRLPRSPAAPPGGP
ncbi:MAG TPA: hypothetical protein VFP65_17085, partial [Anaeromyxobacteraceae bacterium]|nr:hypothetical protein [Anaeromyxobacteraceae bacterium]